jgi:hypothetical protein
MSAGIIRPTGIVLLALAALGAASCGSSAKPGAVTTSSSSSTSVSTSSSTAAATSTSTSTTTTLAGTTTSTSPGLSNWITPNRNPDGSIAIAGFNARLAAENPTWAGSPKRIAQEFLRTDNIDAATTDTQVKALSPQAAEVVVLANGVRDDSVHAIFFSLFLKHQPDQTWRLTIATWSQQCQPGRGHQNFTPALCV